MDVNRISGYIPGKIVFFLMQVSPDNACSMQQLSPQAEPLGYTAYVTAGCDVRAATLTINSCARALSHRCARRAWRGCARSG